MTENDEVRAAVERAVALLEQEQTFTALIPEIRTNIAMALQGAATRADVAAVDGRITVVGGMPKAAGPVRFGVSQHMADAVLSMMRFDAAKRAVMNIRFNDAIRAAARRVADERALAVASFDRADEPVSGRDNDGKTLDWGVAKAVEQSPVIPDIIWDAGGVGKEPVIRIFGADADAVASIALAIAAALRAG